MAHTSTPASTSSAPVRRRPVEPKADHRVAELPAIKAGVMEITLLIECLPFKAFDALFATRADGP